MDGVTEVEFHENYAAQGLYGVTDRQIDRQTHAHNMYCTRIATRSKNVQEVLLLNFANPVAEISGLQT